MKYNGQQTHEKLCCNGLIAADDQDEFVIDRCCLPHWLEGGPKCYHECGGFIDELAEISLENHVTELI